METTTTSSAAIPIQRTIEHHLSTGQVWGLLLVSSALLATLITLIVYYHGTLHNIFFGRD